MNSEIPIEVQKYFEWTKTLERPFCCSCGILAQDVDLIVLNNPGGFGREEVLICDDCIKLPENQWARERLENIHNGEC